MKILNRRSLKNSLVDVPAQMRLLNSYLVLMGVAIAGFIYLYYQVHKSLDAIVLELGESQYLLSAKLMQVSNEVSSIVATCVLLLGLLTIVVWIRRSHRIFGPEVALKRHVERMRGGDFGEELKLRNGDEFKGLAKELNLLTEALRHEK